jgi:5-formyltetrahydrofolate cyclo-ligase
MGDAMPLQFRHWREGEPLYPGGFGTLVPDELASVLQPDLVIIPLLGFDKTGTRLGFGKGYYDRTIAVMDKRPTLVGYAFAAQELDSIPREPHDVPLDYLVTEAGVRQFVH